MANSWEGEWVGVYVNPADLNEAGGHEFGIAVSLSQTGEGIAGTVDDLLTVTTLSLARILASSVGDRMSRLARSNTEAFVRKHPDAVVRMMRPLRATLTGIASGREATLVKSYRGESTESIISAGGRELVRNRVKNVDVEYRLVLSDDGDHIDGTWTIRKRKLLGGTKVSAQGEVRLSRRARTL